MVQATLAPRSVGEMILSRSVKKPVPRRFIPCRAKRRARMQHERTRRRDDPAPMRSRARRPSTKRDQGHPQERLGEDREGQDRVTERREANRADGLGPAATIEQERKQWQCLHGVD